MFEKDPKRFNKIRARKNKNDEAAASNRADAEAGLDLEDDADNDDDDELEQTAPEPTKPAATKKVAPKKRATNVKKPAAMKAGSPSIQDGATTKAVKAVKAAKAESAADSKTRAHRERKYGYVSAPSDSEWEEKRKIAPNVPGNRTTIAKLRETVNRHARWCPFVHMNKRLHHAHRRIRNLQNRPTDESELSYDSEDDDSDNDNGIPHDVDNAIDDGNDGSQKEYGNGKDEVLAEQPGVVDEDNSTALPGNETASKVRVTPESVSALKVKATKPTEERENSAEAESLSGQDPPIDNEDKADDATAGAPNRGISASKAANSNDEASEKDSLTSGEELEAKGEAYLKRQRADAAKKRKVSEAELTSDAELVSKTRKIRAG